MEISFAEILAEKFPSQKNRHPDPGSPKSSIKAIIIKMSEVKDKGRVLKAARENQPVVYREPPSDCQVFFIRNFAGQRECLSAFEGLKEIKCPIKNTLPDKLIYYSDLKERQKSFTSKSWKFFTTKPALQDTLNSMDLG